MNEMIYSIALKIKCYSFYDYNLSYYMICISGLAGAIADVHYYDVLTNKWSR